SILYQHLCPTRRSSDLLRKSARMPSIPSLRYLPCQHVILRHCAPKKVLSASLITPIIRSPRLQHLSPGPSVLLCSFLRVRKFLTRPQALRSAASSSMTPVMLLAPNLCVCCPMLQSGYWTGSTPCTRFMVPRGNPLLPKPPDAYA